MTIPLRSPHDFLSTFGKGAIKKKKKIVSFDGMEGNLQRFVKRSLNVIKLEIGIHFVII